VRTGTQWDIFDLKKKSVGTLDSSVADGGSWVDYVGYHLFSM